MHACVIVNICWSSLFVHAGLECRVPLCTTMSGFKSDAYRSYYPDLKRRMDPGPTRALCFQERLITTQQKNKLQTISFGESHNEELLSYLENGPPHVFATFRDGVLDKEENKSFADIVEAFRTVWDTVRLHTAVNVVRVPHLLLTPMLCDEPPPPISTTVLSTENCTYLIRLVCITVPIPKISLLVWCSPWTAHMDIYITCTWWQCTAVLLYPPLLFVETVHTRWARNN